MEIKEIGIFLDEDAYAIKKFDFIAENGEEAWRLKVKSWLEFENLIKKELFNKGKISKITFNRFRRAGLRIYNFSPNIIMPNKFNEMYNMKKVNIVYFRNAVNKIKAALEEFQVENEGVKNEPM